MRLYVPEIGDKFELTTDWTFTLFNEGRNRSLWELYDCENNPDVLMQNAEYSKVNNERQQLITKYNNMNIYRLSGWSQVDLDQYTRFNDITRKLIWCTITLPKNSVLSVDRVYIRKGTSEWSSISFYLKYHPSLQCGPRSRFWAKLQDCNNINFNLLTS